MANVNQFKREKLIIMDQIMVDKKWLTHEQTTPISYRVQHLDRQIHTQCGGVIMSSGS